MAVDRDPPAVLIPVIWDAVAALCRAHFSLDTDQQLALYAAHGRGAELLSSGMCGSVDWESARQAFGQLACEESSHEPPLVSAALSKALCHIGRRRSTHRDLPARVLVLDGSAMEADFLPQGTALVNCACAAQAGGVLVDCLSLGPSSSVLLRQVAGLAGGKHIALPPSELPLPLGEVLVPLLFFHFAPGVAVRRVLNATVDIQNLAAVCTCHGEAQEIAYVCSCCLAIYCSDASAICAVCRTRFRPDRDADRPLADLGVDY